jgi:ABC-type lipoprotein release transport system permease subunit
LRYELMIALRYLRARRKDAFISITTLFTAVGVTIGVAALVVMLAVMSGFETNLRQRMLSLSPQVQVQSFGGAISNYAPIKDRIDHTPGVAGSDPFIVGQGLISSAHGLSGVVVRGVEPRNRVVISQLQRYVDAAALRALESGFPAVGSGAAHPVPGLLLGATLADKLKVKPGDPVRIVAPIIAGPNAQLSTRSADFRVAAVFASGVQFIDSDVIFMSLRTAQDFFGRQGKADGIEVKLHDLDATTAVTNALRSALGHTFRVSNWMEYDQAASAGFAMLKRVYALVLLLLNHGRDGEAQGHRGAARDGRDPGRGAMALPAQGDNRRRGGNRNGTGHWRRDVFCALPLSVHPYPEQNLRHLDPADRRRADKLRAGRDSLYGAVLPGDDLSGRAGLARDAGRGFSLVEGTARRRHCSKKALKDCSAAAREQKGARSAWH